MLLSVYFINRQSDLLGQNNSIGREQWVQEMEREERKISKYVSMKMKHPTSSEIKDQISNQMKCSYDTRNLSNSESQEKTLLEAIFREQYFKDNPMADKIKPVLF